MFESLNQIQCYLTSISQCIQIKHLQCNIFKTIIECFCLIDCFSGFVLFKLKNVSMLAVLRLPRPGESHCTVFKTVTEIHRIYGEWQNVRQKGKQHPSLQLEKAIGKERKAVSLLSITGKILKQIIKQSIFKDLKDNNVIRNRQHGFSKKKSVRPI